MKNTRERILELYKERMTDKEIARTLNIDPATVRYHRKKLGLESNFKKNTEKRKEEIKRMAAIGHSDQQIARKLGVDKNTVRYHNKERENKRRHGNRGIGKYKENEKYYNVIKRILNPNTETGKLLLKEIQKAGKRVKDWNKRIIATGIEPASKLHHPNPSRYANNAEKINKEAAKYIVEFEKKISRSTMVGVPGPHILILAQIIKTAKRSIRKKLAYLAVKQAKYLDEDTTLKFVLKKSKELRAFDFNKQEEMWEGIKEDAIEWAPEKKSNKKRIPLRFYNYNEYKSSSGKRGRGGGIVNINDRIKLTAISRM